MYKRVGENLQFADFMEGVSEFHLKDTKTQPFSAQVTRPKVQLVKDFTIEFSTADGETPSFPFKNPTWTFTLRLPRDFEKRILLAQIRVSVEHYQSRLHALTDFKASIEGAGPQPDIRVLSITDWAYSFGKDSEYFLECYAVLKVGPTTEFDNRLSVRFVYKDNMEPPTEASKALPNCREFMSCDINFFDFSIMKDDKTLLAIMNEEAFDLLPEIEWRKTT